MGSYIVSSNFDKLKHTCAAVGRTPPLPSAQKCVWPHPKTIYSAPCRRQRPARGVGGGAPVLFILQRLNFSLRAAKV